METPEQKKVRTNKEILIKQLKSIPDIDLKRERDQWSIILYFTRDNPWVSKSIWHNGFSRIITYGEYTYNSGAAVFKEGVRHGYFIVERFFNKENILEIIGMIDNELDSRNKKKAKKKTKKKTRKKNVS